MADLVIDTDVVSFGLRQDSRFVSNYGPAIKGHRGIISFMTIAEMRYGALHRGWGPNRIQQLDAHLSQNFVQYHSTDEICRVWAILVQQAESIGRVINVADAWIAATAVALDIPLVTHNAKHFQFLTPLQLVTFPDN